MRIYKAPGSDYEEIKENFTDTIVYAKSKEDFYNELKQLGLVDIDNQPEILHTPFVENKKGEILTYVRLKDEQLTKLQEAKNIQLLGDYDAVESSMIKKKIYEKVYDTKPRQMVDPETNEVYTYTPPKRFCTFG